MSAASSRFATVSHTFTAENLFTHIMHPHCKYSRLLYDEGWYLRWQFFLLMNNDEEYLSMITVQVLSSVCTD